MILPTAVTASLRTAAILLFMLAGADAWGQSYTTYYSQDYETDNTCDWTSNITDRYTAMTKTSDGNHYVSVDAVGNGDNGARAYTTSTNGKVAAGTDFVISFDLQLTGGSDQASWFQIFENGNTTVNVNAGASETIGNTILSLSQVAANATTWKVNSTDDDAPTVNLTVDAWYSFSVARIGNQTFLTVRDANDNVVSGFDRTEIKTNSTTGGLGNIEFATKRYYAHMAIDNILVRSIVHYFSEESASIDITAVGLNDLNTVTGLPTLNSDAGVSGITYASDNADVATIINTDVVLKAPGTATITATVGSCTASYKLTVTNNNTPTATPTRNTGTGSLAWTLSGTGVFTAIVGGDTEQGDPITMTYAYESEVGGSTVKETAVVVSDATVGSILKIIDGNGWSHANTTGGSLYETAYGGTFYKFVTTKIGNLTIVGTGTAPVLLSSTSTGATVTATTTGTTSTWEKLPAGTYYLYDTYLHSFTFDYSIIEWSSTSTEIDITDVALTNPNTVSSLPTITKGTAVSYASSNNAVAVFPSWVTLGQMHVRGLGTSTISATDKYGVTVSYTLTVTGTATTPTQTLAADAGYDEWKLTSSGTLTGGTVSLTNISMTYTFGTETAISVQDDTYGGYVLKVIDGNGYSHANTDAKLPEDVNGGTFYKFETTKRGILQVTGDMSTPKLLKSDRSTEVAITVADDNKSMTVENLEAGTYYLYNTNNGTATESTVAMLSGFTFTPYLDAGMGVYFYGETIDKSAIDWTSALDVTVASHYTVGSFESSNAAVATVDAGGNVTINTMQGRAYINAVLASDDADTYPTIYASYAAYVTDGEWNIVGEYTLDKGHTLDDTQWIYMGHPEVRTTSDWEYIWTNDGDMLDVTYGMQTKNNIRLISKNPVLYLFTGGQTRFPVRAGMLVDIKAYASANMESFYISNVTNLDGTAVSDFEVNTSVADYQFLAVNDGWVTITNSYANFALNIQYIKVSNDIVFKYGTETYAEAGTTYFQNEILNPGGTTFSYTTNTGSLTIDKDGVIGELPSTATDITVTATGDDTGILAKQSKNYTLHVVTMSVANYEATNTSMSLDLLGQTSINGSTVTSTYARVINYEISNISKTSIVASISGTTLTVNGTGVVAITATLGGITKTFTVSLHGVAFKDMAPAVNIEDGSSYTFTVDDGVSITNCEIDKDNVKGEIIDKDALSVVCDESAGTCMVKGIKDAMKGGIIPVKLTGTYGGVSATVTAVLTVQYTSHTWEFLQDLTISSEHNTFQESYNDGTTSNDWIQVSKSGNEDTYIYAYNAGFNGDNGLVISETAGLQLIAGSQICGIGLDKKNLATTNGCKIVIPHVKAGTWIDICWTRHKEGLGERFSMTNLLDTKGKEITEVYHIGNTNGESNGTYSFQVKGNKGEYTDVTIQSVDKSWTLVHRITLSDRQNYVSTMRDDLREARIVENDGVYSIPSRSDTKAASYTYVSNNLPEYTIDGEPLSVMYSYNLMQKSPNAPSKWTIDHDETLDMDWSIDGWTSPGGAYYEDVKVYFKGGWGKLRLHLESYTSDADRTYVVSHKTWTITVGKAPEQTYPYTWDMTKYWDATASTVKDDTEEISVIKDTFGDKDRTTYDSQTWTDHGDNRYVVTNEYGKYDYESYFVDGAQLVAPDLGNGGSVPETVGLGFSITNKTTGGLTLGMESLVGNQSSGAKNRNGGSPLQAPTPFTWQYGGLTITGGGSITVPKPGDDTNYDDYNIYIRCSVKPYSVTNATESTDDVNSSDNQYRYTFNANDDAVITFSGDVTVYAISVTNITKTMHVVGGVGWATESRDHNIDLALNGYLTTNDVNAYTVTYDSYDMNTATVALTEVKEDGYVAANDGIVMRQTVNVGTGSYTVPLFYPAVTTSASSTTTIFGGSNLMKANVTETLHTSETEDDYTKFILTNVHWTFTEDGPLSSEEAESAAKSADAAGFYRMHIWETTSDADTKNTMAANTAYLCVPTDNLPTAVWNLSASSAPARKNTIAIRTSDIVTGIDEIDAHPIDAASVGVSDDAWYSLSGMKLSKQPTQPGLYIHNGKKVMIR